MVISKLDWITSSGGFRDSHRRQDDQRTEKYTYSELWNALHLKTIPDLTFQKVWPQQQIPIISGWLWPLSKVCTWHLSCIHLLTATLPILIVPVFQSECPFSFCTPNFHVSNVFPNPVVTQRNHALIGPISFLASLFAVSSETFSFSQSQSEAPLSRPHSVLRLLYHFPGVPLWGPLYYFASILYLYSCHNSSFICFICYWTKLMG